MKKVFIIVILLMINFIYSLDYTIPPNTYSIQSGDIDSDGDEDIVVGHINNETYLSILENIGNGEFAIVEQLTSIETRAYYLLSLLDDNVYPDFIFQNEYADLIVFYDSEFNNPYFYNIQAQLGLKTITCGDFDNDGDNDLVFSTWGAGQDNLWCIMYNLGDREFSEPEWFECPNQASNAGFYELECRDLDNNGFDDIIAYTNPETYIYYSDGNSFELDSLNCYAANGTMVSEDMDNDGDYDIVVSYMFNGTTFKFYENIGDHEFDYHEQNFEGYFSIAYPCDINDDQYPDIVNIFGGAGFRIHYNTGNFQFYTELIYLTSYGELWTKPTFSDFDSNGTVDIAFIRYGIEENNLTILYNDGEGNFLDEPQVSVENYELDITSCKLTNYPNPFNPSTTISFNLITEITELIIYNLKGQKIRDLSPSLCHPEFIEGRGEAKYSVTWNGKDENNQPVASGIYLYKLKSGEFEISRKMLLLK